MLICHHGRHIIFGLAVLGLSALPAIALAQSSRVQAPPFNVPIPGQTQNRYPSLLNLSVEEGRVTAEIYNIPLHSVLEELAAWTGIVFKVHSYDNPTVSLILQRISLQEAIQRIASDGNSIFHYGQGSEEQDRIKLVSIFPHTNPPQQPSILYIGTGEITKTSDTLETPEQALKTLIQSTSPEKQLRAMEILVDTKSEVAVQALMRFLSDPTPEVRAAAIEGLASLSAHGTLPDILNALKDVHPGVRQSAAMAVALLGEKENIKDLKSLVQDNDAGVAAAAELAIRSLSAR